MDAKVFSYIFLVLVTLKLQKTSAQSCGITMSGSAQLNVYDSCPTSARNAGPTVSSSSIFNLSVLFGKLRDRIEDEETMAGDSKWRVQRNVQTNSQSSTEFGTKDWPAEALCKSAPSEMESGTYYLGPIENPMTVYCNMATRETCIRTSKTTPEFTHDPGEGAFWLREENVQLKDLYADILVEQLTWLRERAGSVRQTLKYNCLDSVPHSKYNVSSSVQLWAWNEIAIGPYPTNQSPVFYSIPAASDKCVEGSTDWQSSIIELQSSNVYRLPIVDVWIGDIRHAKQKLTIESVELCFA